MSHSLDTNLNKQAGVLTLLKEFTSYVKTNLGKSEVGVECLEEIVKDCLEFTK